MAATPDSSKKPTASAKSMGSVVGETNKTNMSIIRTNADGNLELHTVLLGAIGTHEAQLEQGDIVHNGG